MTWRHPIQIRLDSDILFMKKVKSPGFRKQRFSGAVHSTKNCLISFSSTLLINKVTSFANLAITPHDATGKLIWNDSCMWTVCFDILCFRLDLLTTYLLLII